MSEPRPPSVDRLMIAIRKSGEFPAMARTVGLISTLASSEATASGTLADTILQDYGLTQKVLRLVNTLSYAQHDEVTTITRAVLLMGFERIRSIATGLVLFEHLRKDARSSGLADTLNMSFYSAILGRNIAESMAIVDSEEAFLSGLFHRLGRILVAFYLPEDYAAIEAAEKDVREQKTREVLGMTFEAMGVAVAHELSLPEKLTESMTRITGDSSRRNLSASERLGCIATLANDATEILASPTDPVKKRAELERLFGSYGSQIAISGKVEDLIARSVKDLKDSANTYKLELPGSRFVSGLVEWRVASLDSPAGRIPGLATTSSSGALVSDAADGEDEAADAAAAQRPETILTKGLHEITSLLVGDHTLDDVLRVVLETVYRALGVDHSRVFFLLKDPVAGVARFRFGFGHTASDIKPWFEIPIRSTEDLFSLAFTQQKDIVIKDATSAEVQCALPDWFTARGVPRRYMILLPLVVDKKAVGMFYVDGNLDRAADLTSPVLNYLKVLRGQAALAIRQSASRAPGRR